MCTREIIWTNHFRDRLFERFAINLDKEDEEFIIESLENDEPFTSLPWNKDIYNRDAAAVVYNINIAGEEVMVLTYTGLSGKLRLITALRKIWFKENEAGEYELCRKQTKTKKGKRNIKRNHRPSKKMNLTYNMKKKDLLESDCEPCLVR